MPGGKNSGSGHHHIDVLWFENMGVFSEPIFEFSFLRLTLKQVGTLFGGLLIAYAIGTGVSQLAGVAMACIALVLTFHRPKVMPLEQYVVVALQFLIAKNRRVAEKERVAKLMAAKEDATIIGTPADTTVGREDSSSNLQEKEEQ